MQTHNASNANQDAKMATKRAPIEVAPTKAGLARGGRAAAQLVHRIMHEPAHDTVLTTQKVTHLQIQISGIRSNCQISGIRSGEAAELVRPMAEDRQCT